MTDLEKLKKEYEYAADAAVKSSRTQALQSQYDKAIADRPTAYSGGQYSDLLKQTMDNINNRKPFQYDLNGDMLYQQYKDQYADQGRQAMMDTMGRAAAMTGGYGNSYAQTVGQQTYQGYMKGLNDKVPELYSLALNKYNAEGDDLRNQYALARDAENTEYARYRDTVSDAESNIDRLYRDLAASKANDTEEWNRNYQIASDRYGNALTSQNAAYEAENKAQELALKAAESAARYGTDTTSVLGYQMPTAAANGKEEEKLDKYVRTGVPTVGKDKKTYYTYTNSSGKSVTVESGTNPYTGTVNKDIRNGAFDNGYQPNNINGEPLKNTGETVTINGWEVKVFSTGSGSNKQYWAWDGTKNRYVELERDSERKEITSDQTTSTSTLRKDYGNHMAAPKLSFN